MTDERLQHQISILLRIGITISGILICIGFLFLFINGVPDSEHSYRSGWNIFAVLYAMKDTSPITNPLIYLYSGIVVLMLTPIMRVILTLAGFGLEKDGKYTIISAIVLLVIGVSITVSIVH